MADEEVTLKEKAAFTKEQIVSSKKYAERRDLLNVLLTDDKSYAHAEVEKLIDEFMKKGVK